MMNNIAKSYISRQVLWRELSIYKSKEMNETMQMMIFHQFYLMNLSKYRQATLEIRLSIYISHNCGILGMRRQLRRLKFNTDNFVLPIIKNLHSNQHLTSCHGHMVWVTMCDCFSLVYIAILV